VKSESETERKQGEKIGRENREREKRVGER